MHPGSDSSLVVFGSYCRPGGEVRAFFTCRKLLQDPPLEGHRADRRRRPDPEILPQSRALLRALRFSGISEIEFKIHERTGVAYLIEINPRHWDQHYLGTACGVNLSLEQYLDLTEPRGLASRKTRSLVLPSRPRGRFAGSPSWICFSTRSKGCECDARGSPEDLQRPAGLAHFRSIAPRIPVQRRKLLRNTIRELARMRSVTRLKL